MIRLVLCALVLLGGVGAGRALARPLWQRTSQLADLVVLLEALQNQLLYSRAPLAELAEAAGASRFTAAGRLFQAFGRTLRQNTFLTPPEALEEVLAEGAAELALTAQDLQILRDLACGLGTTDPEGQKVLLARICSALQLQQKEAAEAFAVKGRMYRALGTGGAALLVILLL